MSTTKPTSEIERLIMGCIKPLIRELLMIDPAELIALLRFDRHREISDLVDSATEQFFAPDFLAYREAGKVELDWEKSLSIQLKMIMNTASHAFEFQLNLNKTSASVALIRVSDFPGLNGCPNALGALRRSIKVNSI